MVCFLRLSPLTVSLPYLSTARRPPQGRQKERPTRRAFLRREDLLLYQRLDKEKGWLRTPSAAPGSIVAPGLFYCPRQRKCDLLNWLMMQAWQLGQLTETSSNAWRTECPQTPHWQVCAVRVSASQCPRTNSGDSRLKAEGSILPATLSADQCFPSSP